MLFLDDSTVWLPTQTWSVKNQEYAAIVRTSCCGPGVTLSVGVTALACPRCREASRGLDDVTSGWRGCYCCRLGVVTAYVTSLETTARLFPAVCAACQLSLVRSNAWHLCSAASSSQTVTGNRMTCATRDGAEAEVMIWDTCQWVYKVHVELIIHTVGCLIRLFSDARWPPRGFQSD